MENVDKIYVALLGTLRDTIKEIEPSLQEVFLSVCQFKFQVEEMTKSLVIEDDIVKPHKFKE